MDWPQDYDKQDISTDIELQGMRVTCVSNGSTHHAEC